jgi:hypothetical protein
MPKYHTTPRRAIVQELRREQGMRDKKYPEWIDGGTLNRDRAARQYRSMNAALAVMEALTDDEVRRLLKEHAARTGGDQISLL